MSLAESPKPVAGRCQVDHLVVAADNLAQGARWCRDTLGVEPVAGGRHPLMATHNLLLRLDGEAWPDAYLEIIAIDPLADQPPAAGRARWFGLDDPALRRSIAQAPRLVHWVARTTDISRSQAALAALGESAGDIVATSRATPDGALRWQITVRADGRPQHRGGLPALIEWQGRHPAARLPGSGVGLMGLTVRAADPSALQRAWDAIGVDGVGLATGAAAEPPLEAVLSTPRGQVRLQGGAV